MAQGRKVRANGIQKPTSIARRSAQNASASAALPRQPSPVDTAHLDGREASREQSDDEVIGTELFDSLEDHLCYSSPHPALASSTLNSRASRGPPTPSIVSLSSFKRRPRQPSLLRMLQQREQDAEVQRDDSHIDNSLLRRLDQTSPWSSESRGRKRKVSRGVQPTLHSAAGSEAGITWQDSPIAGEFGSTILPEGDTTPSPLSEISARKRRRTTEPQDPSEPAIVTRRGRPPVRRRVPRMPVTAPAIAIGTSPLSSSPAPPLQPKGKPKVKITRRQNGRPSSKAQGETTANLQEHMPKRPTGRRVQAELEDEGESLSMVSSSPSRQAEESYHLSGRRARRTRPLALAQKSVNLARSPGQKAFLQQRKTAIDVDSEVSSEHAADVDELAKARFKFREVDDWPLEFETRSLGGAGGSSSPWR